MDRAIMMAVARADLLICRALSPPWPSIGAALIIGAVLWSIICMKARR